MKIFADLHIHSRYSKGTSKKITLKNLEDSVLKKGIGLLGTGDFTHPRWLKELSNLKEEKGFLKTNDEFYFVLQTEVNLVFNKGGKLRKIHLLLLSPSLNCSKRIASFFSLYCNIEADGRPTINLDAERFVKEMKKIDEAIEIIPAHIWTPWFGLFGSKSGFDSIEECFGSMTEYIHALETGLSSDPEMNWKISALDRYELVSFSDAHSYWPHRLGREATLFDLEEKSYDSLIKAIKEKKVVLTLEVDPAYGKYHFDGHRKCNFSCSYERTKELDGICPICHRPLTIGVLNRVEELSDRDNGKPEHSHPFVKRLPLAEIIAFHKGKGVMTKSVIDDYEFLIRNLGNEYNILLFEDIKKIESIAGKGIAQLIQAQRSDRLMIKPGYDGEYGKIIKD